MDNQFLDKEQKFYNYRTSDVDGSNIFDIHKGSNSDAQQLLDGSEYWRTHKNTYSEIVEMTPLEYFETCARDCFNEPVSKLIKSRRMDKNTLDHLKQVIQIYKKKFPITYINYAQHGHPEQEGLHRMMVAGDLFGWDTKFPVQIIKWVDEEKAIEEKEIKHKNKIENYLQNAVTRALRYNYYNLEEFNIQLQDEFASEVRYLDEFEDGFNLDLKQVDDLFIISINNKYTCEVSVNEVNFINSEKINDTDLEDVDLDDLSDWMKDLLSDLEIEKKKLTEHHVIVEEFLVSRELLDQMEEELGKDFYNKDNQCLKACQLVKKLCPECELLEFAVSVWKYSDYEIEPISTKGHCVIRYKDKVYDYTSNQYLNYGISKAETQPRILKYDKSLTDIFDIKVYRDKDYVISAI